MFSGPPESAKTLAAYAIALEEIRQGGLVLLIDFEMAPWDARDRLREMGAGDEELEHLIYVEPEVPAEEQTLAELISSWTFSLAILDAAAGAYSLQGLDDNSRADVEAFTRPSPPPRRPPGARRTSWNEPPGTSRPRPTRSPATRSSETSPAPLSTSVPPSTHSFARGMPLKRLGHEILGPFEA